MKRFAILLCLVGVIASYKEVAGQPMRILVGTYTEGTGAEGVYLYGFDAETADTQPLCVAACGNPSFVIPSEDGTMAYAVNEVNDGRQGVSCFSLGEDDISLLGSVTIPKDQVDGEDPCNLLCTGDALLSSNYTGGSLTAFALSEDGRIAGMTQFVSYSERSRMALTGISFGEVRAHMHCAVISPDGKYIFATNLGNDCIHRFDLVAGQHPMGKEKVAWRGSGLVRYGPRHMVFSPDGRFAYLLCELGDQLIVFSYSDGELTPIQTLKAYDGKGRGSADIHLSPDGRFLYTSHRLKKDGIAIFEVNPSSGKVSRKAYQPTGIHPRNFAISPDGRFLLCACRDSNCIEIYAIDPASGSLSPTGKTIEVPAPVCVQFVN